MALATAKTWRRNVAFAKDSSPFDARVMGLEYVSILLAYLLTCVTFTAAPSAIPGTSSGRLVFAGGCPCVRLYRSVGWRASKSFAKSAAATARSRKVKGHQMKRQLSQARQRKQRPRPTECRRPTADTQVRK